MNLYYMVYILTLDRMICVINPLKYILISWITSTTLGELRETIPYPGGKWINNVLTGIAVLYIIFVIITYSTVIMRFTRSREQFQSTGVNQRTTFKKQFLVPGVIILTFILFYAIPYPMKSRNKIELMIYHSR